MHAAMAKKLDVPESVLEALWLGRAPEVLSDSQRVAHVACRQILDSGSLDQSMYSQVEEAFGERGAVEIVALCGYYSAVAFVINTFAVLPPGSAS
jgi:4-carboxymuconolactone decarboxylase